MIKKTLSLLTIALVALASFGAFAQKGIIINRTFENSKIYPGTVRDYQVYVPTQYTGNKPACLLVCMDGILYNATVKLDSLIAAGQMPVCIGVFVNPGVIKDADGKVVRYNRSNEFDAMNGRWAEFLEKEILPQVEGTKLDDGRTIHISADANDHAITGASSGGICAFSAAWFRPDLFSRVYTAVGTFVPMRGGNDYPAIVRKTEPKALRIFMQDGEKDTWNPLFGSWWEYNQLMHSALQFAGYDVAHSWDKGGHSIKHGTLAFNDAMRFLWKDWPKKVKAGKTENDIIKAIVDPKAKWEFVAKYSGHRDTLYFKPNMVVPATADLITNGNHFALYPDHSMLVQNEPGSNWLVTYIVGKDGKLSYGQRFYWLHSANNDALAENGPMAFDTMGNLYVATTMGVQVCDQNGRVRAILDVPQGAVTNLAFVGNTLYIVAGNNLYSRKMKSTGYHHSEKPIVVKSQGQG